MQGPPVAAIDCRDERHEASQYALGDIQSAAEVGDEVRVPAVDRCMGHQTVGLTREIVLLVVTRDPGIADGPLFPVVPVFRFVATMTAQCPVRRRETTFLLLPP
jgi:hypothetical protein